VESSNSVAPLPRFTLATLQPVSPLPDVTPHYALVSYFYDREYYDNPAHAGELGEGIDIGKYVAGGIYVVDLQTLALKWHTHLDLSTDSVSFRAYIYSAPLWWTWTATGTWRSWWAPRSGSYTCSGRTEAP